MKLSKMTQEELESYSYTDLAAMILKEEKKSLNTPTLFKKICGLLNLTEEDYANKIGDFYTTLTTDKTFILLDDASWDLRDRHSVKVTLTEEDTDDEEDLTETEDELDDELDDMAPDNVHDMDDDAEIDDPDLDDVDDVDDDLTIIDEDELD